MNGCAGPVEGGWNSGGHQDNAEPAKDGSYRRVFYELGDTVVCTRASASLLAHYGATNSKCCGVEDGACVVHVTMPKARMWPEMTEICFMLLCMSLVPMFAAGFVKEHDPKLISDKVIDAAGLTPPFNLIVEKVLVDVTPYVVASGTLLVQLIVVALVAGVLYLLIGLLMPR